MSTGMIILICDDRPEESAVLNSLLGNSGFEVSTSVFDKGGKALEHIKAGRKADICILDIIMPDMSGIELAREIRACGYRGEIVFLSWSNDFGSESYEVGAFYYLVKQHQNRRHAQREESFHKLHP